MATSLKLGTRAPVEDGFDGVEVYEPRLWPRLSACYSQKLESLNTILGESFQLCKHHMKTSRWVGYEIFLRKVLPSWKNMTP